MTTLVETSSSATTAFMVALGVLVPTWNDFKCGHTRCTSWVKRMFAMTDMYENTKIRKTQNKGGNIKMGFQINMMTNKISTKTKAFTAKAKMFTGDFQHVITPASTQVNIEHLSDSIAGLQSEFTDESSNYEERPLVSTDYNNDSRSGIVDSGSTMVINETMLKMYVWYDNEWGYSCRMWDLIQMVVGRFNIPPSFTDRKHLYNLHNRSDYKQLIKKKNAHSTKSK